MRVTETDTTVRLDADWSEAAELYERTGKRYGDGRREDWAGGIGLEDALEHGDTSYLDEAEAMLDSILESVDMDSYLRQPSASVAGGSPIVGAYLAGSPLSMRAYREEITQSTQGAIRIYVDRACSEGTGEDEIRKLGIATLALVLALQRVRPVELYVGSGDRPHVSNSKEKDIFMIFRVGERPIDMSAACCALVHRGAARALPFELCQVLQTEGLSLEEKTDLPRCGYISWPRQSFADMLGVEDGDLVIGGLHCKHAKEVARDPVKWIEKQVRLALQGEGHAHETHGEDS